MFYQSMSTEVIAAVAVLVIAVVGYLAYSRNRTRGFRKRFGPEYDHAVVTHGTSSRAEAKLADREARVKTLKLRDLDANERERFVADWQAVQERFVDRPKSAVTQADELISSLLAARGYPKGNFEQRAADISVNYARLMEDYRRASAIAVRPGRADASTEELRGAMSQYHTIFGELTQKPQEKTSAT